MRNAATVEEHKERNFYQFLMSGAANTALTYILFLFLNRRAHHVVACTVVYVAGFILCYVVAVKFVFGTKLRLPFRISAFPSSMWQYVYGLIVLTALTDGLNLARGASSLLRAGDGYPQTQ